MTDPAVADDRLVDLLDAGERQRLADLRRPADRARFLAAHALVRLVLSGLISTPPADLRFTATCARCGGGDHGKPRLVGPGPHLSLAHAGDLVVVATAEAGPVGIDVEEVAAVAFPGFDDVALATAERAGLAALPPARHDRARATWWVRKEAALKATGQGLAMPPSGLVVTAPDEPPRLLAWADDGAPPRPDGHLVLADVRFGDPDVDDRHVAAVALLANPTDPTHPTKPVPVLVPVVTRTVLGGDPVG